MENDSWMDEGVDDDAIPDPFSPLWDDTAGAMERAAGLGVESGRQ